MGIKDDCLVSVCGQGTIHELMRSLRPQRYTGKCGHWFSKGHCWRKVRWQLKLGFILLIIMCLVCNDRGWRQLSPDAICRRLSSKWRTNSADEIKGISNKNCNIETQRAPYCNPSCFSTWCSRSYFQDRDSTFYFFDKGRPCPPIFPPVTRIRHD
jgi:hypothetical protein